MQSVLEKEKQKEIRRRHAANFCTRMRYESPGVGSADSARTSARPFTPQRLLMPAILQTAFMIKFSGLISLY
jgi:hypothetical protein